MKGNLLRALCRPPVPSTAVSGALSSGVIVGMFCLLLVSAGMVPAIWAENGDVYYMSNITEGATFTSPEPCSSSFYVPNEDDSGRPVCVDEGPQSWTRYRWQYDAASSEAATLQAMQDALGTGGNGSGGPNTDETSGTGGHYCPGLGTYGGTPLPGDLTPPSQGSGPGIDPTQLRRYCVLKHSIAMTGECVKADLMETACASCQEEEGTDPACGYGAGLQSVLLWFNLGKGKFGEKTGAVTLHHQKPHPLLFSLRSLTIQHSGQGVSAIRRPDYSLRQVVAPHTLLDFREIPGGGGFDVRVYPRPAVLKQDETGAVILPADLKPERTVLVRRPEGVAADSFEALRMEEELGGKKRSFDFRWDGAAQGWTLAQAGGLVTEELEETSEEIETKDGKTGLTTRTRSVRDATGQVAMRTDWIYRQFPFGKRLVSVVERPDLGAARGGGRRTDYGYWDDLKDGAKYGQLKFRKESTGDWAYLDYDEKGREKLKLTPWKDSPFTTDPATCVAHLYTGRGLEPGEAYYHPKSLLLAEETRVLGVPVAKRIKVGTETPDGGIVQIEEQCASPGGDYGAPGNLRAVTESYPYAEDEPWSGRVRRTESPDGTVTLHTYTRGGYLGDEGVPGDFVPERAGGFIRRETITVPKDHEKGVVGKTVKETAIADSRGGTVYSERRLLTAAGDYGAVLSWTGHGYDDFGRLTVSRDQTGIVGEFRYSPCCNKLEWERRADGTEATYAYDAINRLIRQVVKAPGRADGETRYTYDAKGRILTESERIGAVERVTRHEFDGLGREVRTERPGGYVTTVAYSADGRVTTTTLPGGATRIETRHADGRPLLSGGTSVVPVWHDYGVEREHGWRWSETRQARPDSPRWTRTYENALGRTMRAEQPGVGSGVVLASLSDYDAQGRPVGEATRWDRLGADGKPVEGGWVTAPKRGTYDELGAVDLTGQDTDGDGTLDPAKDRVSRTTRATVKHAGEWWEVTRSWTYPLPGSPQPYLAAESWTRLTGLGGRHPTHGLLVAESRAWSDLGMRPAGSEISPPPRQAGIREETPPEKAPGTLSLTYRDRETGRQTAVTRSATGVEVARVTRGGLVRSVRETPAPAAGALGDPAPVARETAYRYNDLGQRVGETDPRAGESVAEFDPQTGLLLSRTDAAGHTTRHAYYGPAEPNAGQLRSTINAEGKARHLGYNLRGQQTATWGDTEYPLAYEYDEFGQMAALKTYQDAPTENPATLKDAATRPAVTRWHFDPASGVLLRKEYADGKGPDYAYDPAGRLLERKWAREAKTEGNGQKAVPARASADREPTRYRYADLTGELVRIEYPATGQRVEHTYDARGRLAKTLDWTGLTTYHYDEAGRLLDERVSRLLEAPPATKPDGAKPRGASIVPRPTLDYHIARTYDDQGRLTGTRLQSAGNASGPAMDHAIAYTWTEHHQLASVKSLAGEFRYQYAENNPALLTQMTSPVHRVETTREPKRDLIAEVRNVSLALRRETVEKEGSGEVAAGLVLSSYGYRNDALGRRDHVAQTGAAFDRYSASQTVVIAYNDRSEVIAVDYRPIAPGAGAVAPAPGVDPLAAYRYDYDAIGNRKTASEQQPGAKDPEVTTYESNALNQYRSLQSGPSMEHPTHDLDGNLVENAEFRYEWDSENRLIAAEKKDRTQRVTYVYDSQSRLVARRAQVPARDDARTWDPAQESHYLYDGWNRLAELTRDFRAEKTTNGTKGTNGTNGTNERLQDNGAPPSSFRLQPSTFLTWGRDLSGSLQGAGGVGGLLAVTEVKPAPAQPPAAEKVSQSALARSHYFLYDANGNVTQLVDAAGRFAAHYEYDPFGNVTKTGGGELALSNPWRFSTKAQDFATGLVYYGYRYYSPQARRFINRDPIQELGGMNLYAFVGNSPINGVDRLGLDAANDAMKGALAKFLMGSDKRNLKMGGGHPWTVALKDHEHMASVKEEIRSRIDRQCNFDETVTGIQFEADYMLNEQTMLHNARVFLRDLFAAAGFTGKQYSMGSFYLVYTINSVDCSKCRANVSFKANDVLNLFSATRVPKTDKSFLDMVEVFSSLMSSGMYGEGAPVSGPNGSLHYPDHLEGMKGDSEKQWDLDEDNKPFNTIHLQWTWDDDI